MTSILQRSFDKTNEQVEILNAGIGNYNAERYVERFFLRLSDLNPTDIVIHYFLNDAEELPSGEGSFIMRHSQLAVTAWIMFNRLAASSDEPDGLLEHYQLVYEQNQEGYQEMIESMTRLARYAKEKDIRLYLAMVPDVHQLDNYPFEFIHERMRQLTERLGIRYVDLLPAFEGLSPEEVWAMPGDPHPNALGHARMAERIYPILSASD